MEDQNEHKVQFLKVVKLLYVEIRRKGTKEIRRGKVELSAGAFYEISSCTSSDFALIIIQQQFVNA